MFLVLFMAGKRIILNRWYVDVSCGGGGDDVCCIFALFLQLHLGQENEKMKTLGFWYCSAAVGFAGTNEEKTFFLVYGLAVNLPSLVRSSSLFFSAKNIYLNHI